MRRFNLVLLASFRLAVARSRSFSIHDDLLAFPQVRLAQADSIAFIEWAMTDEEARKV